tara:strand:+ start:5607 stop:6635 length:1029 start_codon:yes stop_codon:yes gene_type:complete
MSFGKNKSESSQEFDPEIKRALLNVFGEGERLYKTMPYVPYASARVAPFSNIEMEGMRRTVDAANRGYGLPGMRNAMMATDMGLGFRPRDVTARPITPVPVVGATDINLGGYRLRDTDYSPYMNPYTSNVVDTTLADIERARKMQQNQTAAEAVSAGAFGGDRHALREAATNEAALREAGRTSAQLRSQGFDVGRQMAATDLESQLAAQRADQAAELQSRIVNRQTRVDAKKANMMANLEAQLANQRADLGAFDARQGAARQLAALSGDYRDMMFRDPRVLMQIGGMQREQGQRLLDDVYGRFEEGRDYPIRMFDVLRGAAGMLPNPLTSSSSGRAFNIGIV